MGVQKTLSALADPVRRQILEKLKKGSLSAGEISDAFEITPAAISRHLSILKDAGLISCTRSGKFLYYSLSASVVEEIMLWLSQLKGEKNDD
jgi:DNA-binding transcriptional ArsR family regulator